MDVEGEEAANIPKAAHDEHRWFVRHGVFASKRWSRSMRCDAGERRRGQESKGGGLSLLEMRLRFSLYWVPRSVCRV